MQDFLLMVAFIFSQPAFTAADHRTVNSVLYAFKCFYLFVGERLSHLTPPVNDLVNFSRNLWPSSRSSSMQIQFNAEYSQRLNRTQDLLVQFFHPVNISIEKNHIIIKRKTYVMIMIMRDVRQIIKNTTWLLVSVSWHFWPQEGSMRIAVRNKWITAEKRSLLHD